jgi:hypothetical protein
MPLGAFFCFTISSPAIPAGGEPAGNPCGSIETVAGMSQIAEWNPLLFGGVMLISVVSTKTIAKLMVPAGAPVHMSWGCCEADMVVSQVASTGNIAPSISVELVTMNALPPP